MKFCRNLSRVIDISDPEWHPFFVDYKHLKKIIKTLPALVPTTADANTNDDVMQQVSGGTTSESFRRAASTASSSSSSSSRNSSSSLSSTKNIIAHNQAEVNFFRLIHAEVRKASYFFDKTTQELKIRKERIEGGMAIYSRRAGTGTGNNGTSIHDIVSQSSLTDRWTVMTRSVYKLFRDLLLLETYAIMTYCSFSKILKKHDKKTGYQTRSAFMKNIINQSNFANYPELLNMISHCQALYEEASNKLRLSGRHNLQDDERLFISMIHRLNKQVWDDDEEDCSDDEEGDTRTVRRSNVALTARRQHDWDRDEAAAAAAAENAMIALLEDQKPSATSCSNMISGDDDDDDDRGTTHTNHNHNRHQKQSFKRQISVVKVNKPSEKRQRTEHESK